MSVVLLGNFSYAQEEVKTKENKTLVYYFHNTHRCATCNAVEDITRKTLHENYKNELEKGIIVFESLNIEEDAHKALARKYQVSGQCLLIIKGDNKEDLTNEAFLYARSNSKKLQDIIINTIDGL